MRSLLLTLGVAFLTWMPALGQSYVLNEQTLAHLEGVQVMVSDMTEEAKQDGLTTEAIQNDVELALRSSGVNVYDGNERFDTTSMPRLHVNVNAYKARGAAKGLYAYSIGLKVTQIVQLTSGEYTSASTYVVRGGTGTVGVNNLRDVRDYVKDRVNVFINDWLKVHQE